MDAGEWWNANVVDIEKEAIARGGAPNISDAFTINGYPGGLYNCYSTSNKTPPGTYRMRVIQGKTYLLRIINAALNNQLFFKVAGHTFKVVAVDAAYTAPYNTDVVVVAPGQTTDVLLVADQSPARYYMAARPYASAANAVFDNTTTTGVLEYHGAVPSVPPKMPELPLYNDTPTAHRFYSNLTGLVTGPFWSAPPCEVDEKMLITVGLGLADCGDNTATCSGGINGQRLAASMNNASFQLPTKLSLLEATFMGEVNGVYTTDFPDQPPAKFDYTNVTNTLNATLRTTVKSTRVRKVKFNSTVEIVFQNTALIGAENHPMHLHGFNFYVLAQGFGNYNPLVDPGKFNLFSPQQRNTIAVPSGGWAAIRFRADNPGVWLLHCHLDVHLSWGLSTAIVVENGRTPSTKLPPPPADLPKEGDGAATLATNFRPDPALDRTTPVRAKLHSSGVTFRSDGAGERRAPLLRLRAATGDNEAPAPASSSVVHRRPDENQRQSSSISSPTGDPDSSEALSRVDE
ncbi:unnamed protein product [Cuscuta campestris]|uniref:laccase n=1 Tax=Cuscuta campestris TaxID=132261 RepID=A0A484KF37_9ASTE|nr:unnamed protein product [Cuscuta campestris]